MFEFLQKLFHKRKSTVTSSGASMNLCDVFSEVLGQNLTIITGKQTAVEVRRLHQRSFETLPVLEGGGFFYNTFNRSDSYPFSIFLPEKGFEKLRTTFAHIHGEDVDTVSPARICTWLDGNLSRLFYLEPSGEAEAGEKWQVAHFFALPKSYDPEEREEALWQFSGAAVFRVTAGDYTFFLIIDPPDLKDIERLLSGDGTFRRAVAEQVMLRYTGGDIRFFDREDSIRINIEKNSEFLLGRFFIPLKPRLNGVRARTYYRSILVSTKSGIDTGPDVTRFQLSFNFRDEVFEWYYSFYMSGIEEDRPRLKAIINDAMNFLKKVMNIHGVRGHFLNPNIYPDVSEHVCIEADIVAGKSTAVCRVFVGSDFLSTLGMLLLPPWEVDFLKKNLFVRILSILSLNQTLLRKNMHSFYRDGPRTPAADASGTPQVIRIAELLSLIPADDCRLIIQNFFMAQGWQVNKLQCLFFFEHRVREDEPIRLFMDPAFDSARFIANLPRAKRDEWNRSLSASLNWDELKERNFRAMLELYNAMEEDRVVPSFRTRFLLKNEFKEQIDTDYASAIYELSRDRLYIEQLSQMPVPLVQGVLSRLPLEALALALVEDASDLAFLNRFISQKKRTYLDEEIDFRKEKYGSGDIKPQDILEAMVSLRTAVKKEYNAWLIAQEKE